VGNFGVHDGLDDRDIWHVCGSVMTLMLLPSMMSIMSLIWCKWWFHDRDLCGIHDGHDDWAYVMDLKLQSLKYA
jgi:hypothetical protein